MLIEGYLTSLFVGAPIDFELRCVSENKMAKPRPKSK